MLKVYVPFSFPIFADFYFWAAGFFLAGFFLLIFVGKSAQKNPPGKSPAKSSKIYTTKIPDTFLQRVRPNLTMAWWRGLARYCDTIAAIPPYSAIPLRGQLDVRYPPYSLLYASKCQCDRGLYGGYSAIGCYTWKTKSDRV